MLIVDAQVHLWNAGNPTSPWHRQADALVARMAPGFAMTPLDGADLYPRIRAAHTIVATTEAALFGNVILRKGVIVLPGAG